MRLSKDSFVILNEMYDNYFKTKLGGSVLADCSLAALLRYIKIQKNKISVNEAIKYETTIRPYDTGVSFKDNLAFENNTMITFLEGCGTYVLSGTEELPDGWRVATEPPFKAANVTSALTLVYTDCGKQEQQTASVFVNDSTEQVVIFVDKYLSERLYNRVKACLWLFMPWYYPSLPSREELAFFKLFDEDKEQDTVMATIRAMSDVVDVKTQYYKEKLSEHENAIITQKSEELRRSIESVMNEIGDAERRISDKYAGLGALQAELKAWESTERHPEELFPFFQSHKNIDILSVNSNDITFEITDFLEYYDEEEAKAVITNERSYFKRKLGSEPDSVFKAIFVDKYAAFKVAARFFLRGMKRVSVVSMALSPDKIVMPHPHLYRFGCLGENERYIRQYAERGDWQLQIEQLIGAVKNINFGDQTVCEWMISWVKEHKSVKCLYKDGIAYSYSEIKAMLKKEAKLEEKAEA